MLGMTCKAAYEALAQHRTMELERRIDELELENYHHRLPPLKDIMRRFNHHVPKCTCLSCQREGRWPCIPTTFGPPWPGEPCIFVVMWDAYLRELGVTVDTTRGAAGVSYLGEEQKFCNSQAALWTANYAWMHPVTWVNDYGWGQQLSSLNSPRKKQWDALANDKSISFTPSALAEPVSPEPDWVRTIIGE